MVIWPEFGLCDVLCYCQHPRAFISRRWFFFYILAHPHGVTPLLASLPARLPASLPRPPALSAHAILRLRPCRRPLWQSQASWLLAWRLGNILIGSLACWILLSVFCFASTVCWSVCWFIGFWMLVSMLFFWYLQLPRYSP